MNFNLKNAAMLIAVVIVFSAHLSAQDAHQDSEYRVFRMQHVDARESKATIEELIGPKAVRMSIDVRTNSVFVLGKKEDVAFVIDLINQIDVPPQRKPDDEAMFVSYPFPDQRSLQQGFNIVQSMLAGEPGVKMDTDSPSMNLYLQATQKQHQLAKNLFEELAQSDMSKKSTNVHVATYLIVDGKEVEDHLDQLKKPKGKLSQVLASATNKGLLNIGQPLVASQISSLVSSAQQSEPVAGNQASQKNGYFENQSSGDWFQFRNDGMLTQISQQRFRLKSQVQIKLRANNNIEYLAEISGDIELPVDHPVLLSFSTIGGIDSAVIIILTSE